MGSTVLTLRSRNPMLHKSESSLAPQVTPIWVVIPTRWSDLELCSS
jgi:hypothetical protein